MKICKINECNKKHFCKGYCTKHYKRYTLTGDPLKTPTGRKHGVRSICKIDNCESVVEGHGYCRKHYKRWKKYGDPHMVKIRHTGKHLNSEGYVLLYRPKYKWVRKDGTILEHRYIMEQYLDRKLEKYEIVHHKNGIRNDNKIKNLEVLSVNKHHKGSELFCQHCGEKVY